LKIENLSKVPKNKPKINKEKQAKPVKTIINIPNANFKKLTNVENGPINNDLNLINKESIISSQVYNDSLQLNTNINALINNPTASSQIKNNNLMEIPNKNNQLTQFSKLKEGTIEKPTFDDDTNEGIPAEYIGLVNMPYKTMKNNDLKDINSKNMRLNTDDNAYGMHDNFYNNMKVSPIKDPSMKYNIINNNINSNLKFGFFS